jgi:PAS domain S-box-containing protein
MDSVPAPPLGPLPNVDVARDLSARIVDAVTNVTNPIFVKDEQHRLVVVNDAFGALLGRQRAEIVGRTDFDFVPAEEARIFQAKDKVVLQSGIPDENEESLTNAAGITHWIVTRKSLITTPDGGRFIVGVITDITERRKAELELRAAHEELKAAMEKLASTERLATIGHVAATVSHELRNPLGAIRNSMALVHQMTAGKQLGVERALDRVDRNIERCTTIITALLEFTHKKEIARAPIAIDAWLGEVLTQCKIPDDVVMSRELAANDKVSIDKQRFRQAVIHLVDNAAQALKDPVWRPAEGHPRRITVRSEITGSDVLLTIGDTGPGIGADVLPRIFEPLFTTKSFGVGLGLPTVRQIVEQHGGAIDIDSGAGAGTTVRIRLPRLAETGPSQTHPAGRDAAA